MRSNETLRVERRRLTAVAGAAIAVGGYVHFCLYRRGYRAIPKIGTAFLLQVLASVVVASALLFFSRERSVRLGRLTVRSSFLTETVGLALSLGTLAAFALSRTPSGLLGFREGGLQPAPQALITVVAELAALVLLSAALVIDRRVPESVPFLPPLVKRGHARVIVRR